MYVYLMCMSKMYFSRKFIATKLIREMSALTREVLKERFANVLFDF